MVWRIERETKLTKEERWTRCPTIVAVWLVIMFGVGESQHWVGAAGQAGAPPGCFSQTAAAPEPHGALWWHHSLTVGIQVGGRSNWEAAVGEAHLRAERQASTWRRLTDPQLTEAEMLTWDRNRWRVWNSSSLTIHHFAISTICVFYLSIHPQKLTDIYFCILRYACTCSLKISIKKENICTELDRWNHLYYFVVQYNSSPSREQQRQNTRQRGGYLLMRSPKSHLITAGEETDYKSLILNVETITAYTLLGCASIISQM